MASSREKHRQPNIPKGSYPREEVVNLRGTEEAPSFSPVRPNEPTREANCANLMGQVVERENLLSALRRVREQGCGRRRWNGDKIPSTLPDGQLDAHP